MFYAFVMAFLTLTDSAVDPPCPWTCARVNFVDGVNCTDGSTCCGVGTMHTSCVQTNGTTKCCEHFDDSKQCEVADDCCGSGGPDASSLSYCCKDGSKCCGGIQTDDESLCCNATATCCRGSAWPRDTYWCCPQGKTCDVDKYSSCT